MKKIINVVFCPQDMEDTRAAIDFVINNVDDIEIFLECDVNLIHIDCLSLLSSYGFRFSPSLKKFYLPKKEVTK